MALKSSFLPAWSGPGSLGARTRAQNTPRVWNDGERGQNATAHLQVTRLQVSFISQIVNNTRILFL